MKTRTFTRFGTARQLLSILLILGLAFALWPTQVAQAAAQHRAGQADMLASSLPIALSNLAHPLGKADVGLTPAQTLAPPAQASVYLYTITLPPGTAVVMGEQRAVLPFTVGNDPSSSADIDSVLIEMSAGTYWIHEATAAPPGWQVTQIKNAGAGLAFVRFDVLDPAATIAPGSSLTFDVIVAGYKFGVFPTAPSDTTDTLRGVTIKGDGTTFTLSGVLPIWPRRALSATLSASPSSVGVDGTIALIMEVTNHSAITQTTIVPSTPSVTGSGSATRTSGPSPTALTLPPGQTGSFTWAYRAVSSGEVTLSASASNSVASTAVVHSEPVRIGQLTAVLDLEDPQVIGGQLATVNMRVQNNGTSAVLDVEPSDLSTAGTATAALASGPEPPIVPYLDAGATASFRWTYTIDGDVGATYAFSGTASAAGGTSSNLATSAQGTVKRYLVTITPRYAVIGTLNQALVFDVTNGGAEAVNAIDFTIPREFSYVNGNASGGYGGNWTVGKDGVGTPQYIEFSAPASQELPPGATASFTITFAAMPLSPAEYSFAVRVEDTNGDAEYVEARLTVTAFDVTVDAAPSSGLYADGQDTSTITAIVTSGGAVQPGQEVRFVTTVGVLSPPVATTNASGVATTTLVAPHSSQDTSATVTALCNGAQDSVVVSYLGSYELTTNIVGSGTVTRDPHLVGYALGVVVTLTAVPDPGWSFGGWSGDLTGTTNPVTITMDGPKVVTATFTQDQYTLAVNVVEGGSVAADPAVGPYLHGQVVTLTATADVGWSFADWSGDLDSSENPATITIVGNTSITATFIEEAYALTTYVVGQGAITRNSNEASYHYGDVVTVTAVPEAGWTFYGWSGDLMGASNPETVTITGDTAITATFTQDVYAVVLSTDGDGSASADPDQATYVYGDVVTVTAVPAAGWSFSGWSGDLSGTTNPAEITIQGNAAVTATFTEDEYTLTLDRSGGGSVTADPAQATYAYGDVVTLTADADLGWTFIYWYGDLPSPMNPANPMTITVQADMTVIGLFAEIEYSLSAGSVGAGIVTRDPDDATYHFGDVVTVTAVPSAGWSFEVWSGDLTGADNPDQITIVADTSITATFVQDQYALTLNTEGNGLATADPEQLTYVYGDVITVTAVPSTGWSFAGWSGDLTGTDNPVTTTIAGDTVITATFTEAAYALTLNMDGDGSITADPDQASYAYGEVVTLTAAAELGWSFAGWSGDLSGSDNPDTVTITGDTVITATFTQDEYVLTVNLDPAEGGTVSQDPNQATYPYGDAVTLTAVANSGWMLGSWSGALSGTANPQSLTITGDTVVTATFQSATPIGPFTSLAISPKTGNLLVGQSITYTAMLAGPYGTWDVSADATFSIAVGAGGDWIANNVFQAGNVGEWTVTVQYGGLADEATLIIGQVKLYLPIVFRLYGP
jgi:uncharacterized repeat protein (TIGR02543 family)